jgi:23S rRNA pseudouridine2605 synthase
MSSPVNSNHVERSVRLNKHLAHTLGISRREADEWISQGRIAVNGVVARTGMTVDPVTSAVAVDGSMISRAPHTYQYVLMNKPVGYICSRRQQGNTPTIYQILPKKYHHLKVAGRLDKDSCGLLLLTDDGDTILQLTHPRFGKEKIYHVQLHKPLSAEDKEQIESGVELEDGASKFTISDISTNTSNIPPNTYKVTISEGRNRQIRRTFGSLRYMVKHLERISFGPYKISQLDDRLFLEITE